MTALRAMGGAAFESQPIVTIIYSPEDPAYKASRAQEAISKMNAATLLPLQIIVRRSCFRNIALKSCTLAFWPRRGSIKIEGRLERRPSAVQLFALPMKDEHLMNK